MAHVSHFNGKIGIEHVQYQG